jgi:hypothetical protein
MGVVVSFKSKTFYLVIVGTENTYSGKLEQKGYFFVLVYVFCVRTVRKLCPIFLGITVS